MRAVLITAGLIWAFTGAAQQKPAAAAVPSVDEIIEKNIEATGGRKAMERLSSTMAKGTMEMPAQGMHSTMEFYAKAPNKRLIVTNIEGFGEVRQGFDGNVAWSLDPARGLIELDGEQLAEIRLDATFNADLKWRDLYPKAQVKGKDKLAGRDVWVVELAPAAGKPVTRYYDAETFLLLRQLSNRETPQGSLDIIVDFADYRDVGDGVKAPFEVKQVMPVVGEVRVKMSEMRNNVEIDDTRFTKPPAQ